MHAPGAGPFVPATAPSRRARGSEPAGAAGPEGSISGTGR